MNAKRIAAFWRRQGKLLLQGVILCLPTALLLVSVLLILPAVRGAGSEKKEAEKSGTGKSEYTLMTSEKRQNADGTSRVRVDVVKTVRLEKHGYPPIEIDLDEYLVGVLLAEVSPDYHEAALEAQAIAARTYCLYRLEKGLHHESGADVCDDYTHCMAYLDPAIADEESVSVMRRAVENTKGQVILYDGQLIDAVFHDSSSFYTESALAVWGVELPYLQAVASPEEVKEEQFTYTAAELFSKMNAGEPPADAEPFGGVTQDPAGRADTVTVCGVAFPATKLRLALGLPSTSFRVTYAGGAYTFHVYGWGHGVGMSQKGAERFAASGANAEDILLHYYSGCRVSDGENQK